MPAEGDLPRAGNKTYLCQPPRFFTSLQPLFIFLFLLVEDDLVAPAIKPIPAIVSIRVTVLLAEGFAIDGPLDVPLAARSLGRLKET